MPVAGLLLQVLLLLALPSAGSAQGLIQTTPPAGFEELLQPQDALVDVAFEGELVGSFLVTFRPGALRFAEPAAVVAALPGVRRREAVVAALSGEIDTNSHRLCGPNPFPGCGLLDPEVAGVIFDPDRFHATLFVAAPYRDAVAAEYLPAPPLRPGFVQSFAGAAAGSGSDHRAGLRSFSLLSLGAARLRSELGVDSDAGASLDQLKGEYDRGRWRGESGLYRITPLPLLGERRFLGAGITTTLDTLRDSDQVIGSGLSLFLPERSQVEIYRDGRLLSARTYDPGTRDLHTADLPEGAYFLTLRILGPSGVREETRFFTKSIGIPPAGQPLWRLQAGVLVDDDTSLRPKPGRTPFLHGSTRHRITDALALGGDAVLSAEQQGVGGVLFYLLPQAQLQLDGFATGEGVRGLGFSARGDRDRLGYSASLRRIWGAERPRRRTRGADGELGFALRDPDRLFDAGGTATQANLAVSYRLPQGPSLGLRGSFVRAAGRRTYAVGPVLSWALFTDGRRRLDLHADATATNSDRFLFAQLRFSWGNEKVSLVQEAGWQGALGERRSDGRRGFFGRSSGTWHAWDDGAQRLDVTAAAAADEQLVSGGAGLSYRGPRGRADGSLERDSRADSRYGANLFFNIVGDPDGLALGGPEVRESAVVVTLAGGAGSRFRVLVDEQPQGEVAGDGSLVLPLTSYDSYDIRIVQVDGGFVDYDASTRRVTLFPGNVRTLAWALAPVVSVFGRATRPDGSVLAHGRFPDLQPAGFTDADGWFQLEVRSDSRDLLLVEPSGRRCRLALPPLPRDRDYLNVGSLSCRPDGER